MLKLAQIYARHRMHTFRQLHMEMDPLLQEHPQPLAQLNPLLQVFFYWYLHNYA
jgi:hypothetical protein